jgi:hypothetical protein
MKMMHLVNFTCNNCHDELFRYVTSIYFVVTTATTVGYGDVLPHNENEKGFMLFLEFSGIGIFSWISGRITNLKKSVSIADIV